jgi:hypothetical protein
MNRLRCVPAHAETAITSKVKMHRELPPEPRCVCAPTDRLEEFTCPGPPVHSVSPKSGAIPPRYSVTHD